MKRRVIWGVFFLALMQGLSAWAESDSTSNRFIPENDRIRISEAFRIGEHIGDRIWGEWTNSPFAILLVTPEWEFLIRHPKPSEDFELIAYDSLLCSNVYVRKKVFGTHFLATFPAVGGVPTIVMGQPENTIKKKSTEWVITVLHEHFHQRQNSQPNYYSETDALDLSGGDNTGMWMLNFPFPYEQPDVYERVNSIGKLLAEVLQTESDTAFSAKLAHYLEERQRLTEVLQPKDYSYFSFQLWLEGIARFTEYAVAIDLARNYKPTGAFKALEDYTGFGVFAEELREKIESELLSLEVEKSHRLGFYALGAGEALLLERANPNWKELYFDDMFYIENYFIPTQEIADPLSEPPAKK